MLTTVSCSQARRRLRRLIALVAQGHSFVITKNGRAICRLEGAEAIQVDHGTHLAQFKVCTHMHRKPNLP
jgi:prevent-host-death family protein